MNQSGVHQLKIIFLGTGACVANPKRGSPSLLVEAKGDRLLFDCGSGTTQKLESIGVRVSELEHLFITYLHLDHISDYPAIVHDRALSTRKRLNAYGPEGLSLHTQILFTQLYPELSLSGRCFEFFAVKEVHEGIAERKEKWQVTSAPVLHAGGIAYKIETPSKSILYSGDTAPCNSLIKLGLNVDVAILECSFPNEEPIRGEHLFPKHAATLATKMKAKRLILTHMCPECQGKEKDMYQEARNYYTREIIFAEDKMEIKVCRILSSCDPP